MKRLNGILSHREGVGTGLQRSAVGVAAASPNPTTESKLAAHANNFNFLRVVLACTVVFSHSFPLLHGADLDPIVTFLRRQKDLPTEHPIDLGHLSVYGFFVISGYLVTMSWQHSKGLGDYLRKRVLRIFPGLAVVVLFDLGPFGYLTANHPATYWKALVSGVPQENLVLAHAPFPYVINGSLWTIGYEFLCYILVALLGMAAVSSNRMKALTLTLFVTTYGLYALHCSGHWLGWLGISDQTYDHLSDPQWRKSAALWVGLFGDPIVWSRMAVYFLAGMCAFLFRDRIPYRRGFFLASIALMLGAIFAVPAIAYALPLFGSYALLCIAFSPRLKLAEFGKRVDLSYGLYLYAFPLQQILVHWFGNSLNPYTLFLAALLFTAGLAALSWFLVESPMLKLKKRIKSTEAIR